MPKAFISYRRADSSSLADLLADRLKRQGIEAFVDTRSIHTGGLFPERLRRAIEEADVYICLLGPTTLESEWVREEIRYAHSLRKLMIPVFQERFEASEPIVDEHISALLQYDGVRILDVQNEFIDESIAKLVRLIRGTATTPIALVSERISQRPIALLGIGVAALGIISALALLSDQRQGALSASESVAISTMTAVPAMTNTPAYTRSPESIEIALARAREFNRGNLYWEPFDYVFPDDPVRAEVMLVPPGEFTMGSDIGGDDERPAHQQQMRDPFWIDRTEVTKAHYQLCESAGVCTELLTNSNSSYRDMQPVNSVTWIQAHAFCVWRGFRLPTEAEWEYAARGPDGWVYAWGNQWIAENAVWRDNSNNEPADVNSRPEGASWVGALDMTGNVWEWVNSIHTPYPYTAGDGREADTGNRTDIERVIRGGAFGSTGSVLRTMARAAFVAGDSKNSLGFRCARSIEGNDQAPETSG